MYYIFSYPTLLITQKLLIFSHTEVRTTEEYIDEYKKINLLYPQKRHALLIQIPTYIISITNR